MMKYQPYKLIKKDHNVVTLHLSYLLYRFGQGFGFGFGFGLVTVTGHLLCLIDSNLSLGVFKLIDSNLSPIMSNRQ